MNRWSAFLLLGAVQFVATVALTFAEYDLGFARFGTGAPAATTERAVEACAQVLRFPLVTGTLATGLRFPGPAGSWPLLLNGLLWALVPNSLLWALVASGLLRGLRELPHRPAPRPAPPAGDA